MKRNNKKRKINIKKLVRNIFIIAVLIAILIFVNKIIINNDSLVNETSSFPEEVYGVKVHTQLIEEQTKARPGTKRKIKYIVIHETDNFTKGTGAKNHAEFLSNNNNKSTSWHYTVDDKEIYHHIPDNEVANHAATKDGNLYGIGVELCVNEDGNFEKTFDNACKLVAYLTKEYKLSIKDIKTHHDFSGKDCPHSILQNNRMGEFIKKVKQYMK